MPVGIFPIIVGGGAPPAPGIAPGIPGGIGMGMGMGGGAEAASISAYPGFGGIPAIAILLKPSAAKATSVFLFLVGYCTHGIEARRW